MERLQKVIAQAGIASRRKAEELILAGKVTVNDQVIKELGTKVNPLEDDIKVEGVGISTEKKQTYLFHKPAGVITSVTDPQGRPVVVDYFKHVNARLFPIGRLDYDTSGLLLLTNDGELAHRLTHPSFHFPKGYTARVKGIPSPEKVAQLANGIELEDGWTAPAQAELKHSDVKRNQATILLTIHEGRNRQVRRMCSAIGHPVLKLHRHRYGFLTLAGLEEGKHRQLSQQEIDQLMLMTKD